MDYICARITTADGAPWSAEDIAKAQAVQGAINVVVEGPDSCCICFQISNDVAQAKVVTRTIAKTFPGVAVHWVTDRKVT